MKYVCLRDCFVDKMYKKGITYILPESIGGEPKNFRLLDAAPVAVVKKAEAPVKITPKAAPVKKVTKPVAASKVKKPVKKGK